MRRFEIKFVTRVILFLLIIAVLTSCGRSPLEDEAVKILHEVDKADLYPSLKPDVYMNYFSRKVVHHLGYGKYGYKIIKKQYSGAYKFTLPGLKRKLIVNKQTMMLYQSAIMDNQRVSRNLKHIVKKQRVSMKDKNTVRINRVVQYEVTLLGETDVSIQDEIIEFTKESGGLKIILIR